MKNIVHILSVKNHPGVYIIKFLTAGKICNSLCIIKINACIQKSQRKSAVKTSAVKVNYTKIRCYCMCYRTFSCSCRTVYCNYHKNLTIIFGGRVSEVPQLLRKKDP